MTTPATIYELQVPDVGAAKLADEALAQLTAFLHAHPASKYSVLLSEEGSDGGTQIVLPAFVLRFLTDVLTSAAATTK